MAIDPNTETIVSLSEVPRGRPRRRAGKKPHISCIYRWTTSGCRGVILESIQIGGTRCTSKEALRRFFEALTVQAEPQAIIPQSPRQTRQRRQQIEAAERRLAKAGI